MSNSEMIFSSLVVMVITWFPVWAYDREMGLWKFTKIVFWSVFGLTEIYFLVFPGVLGILKTTLAAAFVALMGVIFAWFVYFGQNMFKDRE